MEGRRIHRRRPAVRTRTLRGRHRAGGPPSGRGSRGVGRRRAGRGSGLRLQAPQAVSKLPDLATVAPLRVGLAGQPVGFLGFSQGFAGGLGIAGQRLLPLIQSRAPEGAVGSAARALLYRFLELLDPVSQSTLIEKNPAAYLIQSRLQLLSILSLHRRQ